MVFYLVGLGLGSEEDVTVKGRAVIERCKEVWLESFTAILPGVSVERLSEYYGRPIQIADRDRVEQRVAELIELGRHQDVAMLVVGDPFGATTHTDLWLRCHKAGVPVRVVHNASIMNAVGACGLSLYRFGQTVSIPLFQKNWRPDSFYERIQSNKLAGLHTLCLLDIKVKEPNLEILETRGKFVYDPPYYMSISEAINQLLEVESNKKLGLVSPDMMCIGVARIGCDDQVIAYGKMSDISKHDFGLPLHSLVLVGEVHPMEMEMLEVFKI